MRSVSNPSSEPRSSTLDVRIGDVCLQASVPDDPWQVFKEFAEKSENVGLLIRAVREDVDAIAEISQATEIAPIVVRAYVEAGLTKPVREELHALRVGNLIETSRSRGMTVLELLAEERRRTGDERINTRALKRLITAETLTQEQQRDLDSAVPTRCVALLPQGDNSSFGVRTVKLGPAATEFLVDRLEAELVARLVPGLDNDISGEELQQHIARSLKSLTDAMSRSPEVSDALVQLRRIVGRGAWNMDAEYDSSAGKVYLREATHPLPDELVRNIDQEANSRFFRDRVRLHGGATLDEEHLCQRIPSDVLAVLEAAGLRQIDVYPTSYHLSTEACWIGAITRMSRSWNPIIAWRAATCNSLRGKTVDMRGVLRPRTANVEIADSRWSRKPDCEGTLLHELMHALSFALGVDGAELSKQPEFFDLFVRTLHSQRQGDGRLNFPTDNAYKHPSEAFVDCALAYLNLHYENIGDEIGSATRQDLERLNPEIFAFMEKLFLERVPEAVRTGRIAKVDEWHLSAAVELALHVPQAQRTTRDWLHVAAYHANQGARQNDTEALERAESAVMQAWKAMRPVWTKGRWTPSFHLYGLGWEARNLERAIEAIRSRIQNTES